ncbi:MAG: hypothetical protein WBD40_21180 [Tepidisphaeraceae bacterium]
MLSPLVRRVARLLVLVCVLAAGFGPTQDRASRSAACDEFSRAEPTDPVAAAEVRLRKLHLVRPDLIPYPIAYEVCC